MGSELRCSGTSIRSVFVAAFVGLCISMELFKFTTRGVTCVGFMYYFPAELSGSVPAQYLLRNVLCSSFMKTD